MDMSSLWKLRFASFFTSKAIIPMIRIVSLFASIDVHSLWQGDIYLMMGVIKTDISNLVRTTRFWNNLHQVRSKSKDWKAKKFKSLGAIKPKGLSRIAKID